MALSTEDIIEWYKDNADFAPSEHVIKYMLDNNIVASGSTIEEFNKFILLYNGSSYEKNKEGSFVVRDKYKFTEPTKQVSKANKNVHHKFKLKAVNGNKLRLVKA